MNIYTKSEKSFCNGPSFFFNTKITKQIIIIIIIVV